MNANTALIMFAAIAAFGLATATLVSIQNEAHAIAVPAKRPGCTFTPGACKTGHPG